MAWTEEDANRLGAIGDSYRERAKRLKRDANETYAACEGDPATVAGIEEIDEQAEWLNGHADVCAAALEEIERLKTALAEEKDWHRRALEGSDRQAQRAEEAESELAKAAEEIEKLKDPCAAAGRHVCGPGDPETRIEAALALIDRLQPLIPTWEPSSQRLWTEVRKVLRGE